MLFGPMGLFAAIPRVATGENVRNIASPASSGIHPRCSLMEPCIYHTDLLHTSVWERAHRTTLELEGSFRKQNDCNPVSCLLVCCCCYRYFIQYKFCGIFTKSVRRTETSFFAQLSPLCCSSFGFYCFKVSRGTWSTANLHPRHGIISKNTSSLCHGDNTRLDLKNVSLQDVFFFLFV